MSESLSTHDLRFIQHALDLARKGVGLASPNPTVGCVLVRNGEILGEGFHQYDKRDHAEIVALQSPKETSRGATLYVTLEPCNHTGRTGPCTEAIISAGIQRVVAAMEDPNPRTSGAGFARLQDAGIEVTTGVLEQEAQRLNEGFACWIRTGKPFVTLKSALTLDGQLALPENRGKLPKKRGRAHRPLWITSEESRAEVQRMRHASDALLTGIGTIRADDPLLTDRSGLPRRRPLLRVVMDSQLSLSPKSRIVQSAKNDLLVFTNNRLATVRKAKQSRFAEVEFVHLPLSRRAGSLNLQSVLEELARRNILNVLLETGPTLNGAAFAAGIVDKLVLFYAPKLAGDAHVPFAHTTGLQLPPLQNVRAQTFGPDLAIEAYLRNPY